MKCLETRFFSLQHKSLALVFFLKLFIKPGPRKCSRMTLRPFLFYSHTNYNRTERETEETQYKDLKMKGEEEEREGGGERGEREKKLNIET